jgi:voltage-gated potassium channel
MTEPDHETREQIHSERWTLMEQVNAITDKPLVALSFVWLVLLVLDFTRGLGALLQIVSYVIWVLFLADFLIEFTIAPRKQEYLRKNWLTAFSLLLPALRILRIFRALRVLRAARAVRSVSFLRLLTSLNRGMRAISKTLGQRGIGYVIALTAITTFAGAAGMYTFESPAALREAQIGGSGLASYGEAVWWTAMIMTTLGSDYWPQTAEGRLLGWLLALFAFAVFGYITATIASFFVSQDANTPTEPVAHEQTTNDELAALRAEVTALRHEITQLGVSIAARSSGS